jgi:hypothetical protein
MMTRHSAPAWLSNDLKMTQTTRRTRQRNRQPAMLVMRAGLEKSKMSKFAIVLVEDTAPAACLLARSLTRPTTDGSRIYQDRSIIMTDKTANSIYKHQLPFF